MVQHATWPEGPTIKFKLGSAVLVFSPHEMQRLLSRDLDLFGQALLRGKACRRRKEFRARTGGTQARRGTVE